MTSLGFKFNKKELARAEIIFQSSFNENNSIGRPDAEIKIGDQLHLLIEAKIGTNHIYQKQIELYSSYLEKSPAQHKCFICITQINELKLFKNIIKNCKLPHNSFIYLKWYQIIDILKQSIDLTQETIKKNEKQIIYGKKVDYSLRISSLFIKELEDTMYDKKIINEIKIGEIPDITVTTQDPWFMKAALIFNVWFPSDAAKYGLKPSKYVAYYETMKTGNENPKTISYIAKNKIYWNRITLSEAKQLDELKDLFANKDMSDEISKWGSDDDTFHIVLTEKPIKLSKSLPLIKSNYARILSKRKYSFSDIISANSIDELIKT